MTSGSENHFTQRRRSVDARGRRSTRGPRSTRRDSSTGSAHGGVLKSFLHHAFDNTSVVVATPPSSSRTVNVTRNGPAGLYAWTTLAATMNGAVPPWLCGRSGDTPLLKNICVTLVPSPNSQVAVRSSLPGSWRLARNVTPACKKNAARSASVHVQVDRCRTLKLWWIRTSWPSGKTTIIQAGLSPPGPPFTGSLSGEYVSVAVTWS